MVYDLTTLKQEVVLSEPGVIVKPSSCGSSGSGSSCFEFFVSLRHTVFFLAAWYDHLAMAHLTPIDISNIPELVRIAEEVEATKTPRELKQKNKTVAVITPVKKASERTRQEKTKADCEAFKATGSWKDVDWEKLIAKIYRWRQEGSLPANDHNGIPG